MTTEWTYAAIHLGDGPISVLVVTGDAVAEFAFGLSAITHDGTLEFLATASDAGGEGNKAVCHPTRFVDDTDVLVGTTLVRTESLFRDILVEALRRAGVPDGVDVLEIACPATWGIVRTRVVRSAAMPLAREVSIADAAVATVESVGERAPPFAIVVELAELESVVSVVSAVGDGTYVRTGRWDALGASDLATGAAAGRSILERVTAGAATGSTRAVVDVFVLDTSGLGDTEVLAEESFRVHRTTGVDIVRSMAARAGLAIEGSNRGRESPGLPPAFDTWRTSGGGKSWTGAAPMPARAASWLGDVEAVSTSERRRPIRPVLASAGAVAVLVSVLVVAMVTGGREGPSVAPGASGSVSGLPPVSSTLAPPVSTAPESGEREQSDPDGRALATFDHGRVSVRLPATWTQRVELDRTVLVPPDLPDWRIILTTTALRPGATFDEVADELTESIQRREADGVLGELQRATDIGGRVALSYTESPDADSTVYWQILVEHDLQISVGCQSSVGQSALLEDDCAQVVSTLTVSR